MLETQFVRKVVESMKILLLFSLCFFFLANCARGELGSGDEVPEEVEGTIETTDIEEEETEEEEILADDLEPANDVVSTIISSDQINCAKYVKNCKGDVECGDKYNYCLRPNAGAPVSTEKTVCAKEGARNIVFTLNLFDNPASQNRLLCDLIQGERGEPDRVLRLFATITKSSCRKTLNYFTAELEKASYTCNVEAPLAE